MSQSLSPSLHCPYCKSVDFVRAGFSRKIRCLMDRRRQRLRCKNCSKRFASNALSLSYYLKHADPALNAKIFNLCVHGLSNRGIGRILYVSEHCVRLRLVKLAQQALSFHSTICRDLKIEEPVGFDGLENFAGSQYDPNNIQQGVGQDSLFIYDFNFASLNRKGRMSPWQKKRLSEIEAQSGRYNPKSIRVATKTILKRLHSMKAPGRDFVLLSDEHFQYRLVIERDLRKTCQFEHVTISSKACRNFQNILFSVNHADLLIRQRLGAFARETISFSKTPGAMCQKYALFMVYKNYLVPQFTKKLVTRPEAHLKSPAQLLGLSSRRLRFEDVFHRRSRSEDLEHLNREWRAYWQGKVPTAFHRHGKYRRMESTAA